MSDGRIDVETRINTDEAGRSLQKIKADVKKTSDDMAKSLDNYARKSERAFKKSGEALGANTKKQKSFGDALKAASPQLNSFNSSLQSIAAGGGALAVAIAAAIGVVKKLGQAMRATSDAFRAQNDAETSLKIAADNNPYLNGEGVKRLGEYAKELQKVTELSDNEALDVMSQLANTGRSEAEIMKIMGAAADYAAATHTDLASAAMTLNATYSGMTGQLGKQHAAIKNLTEEQLKNGEAIDIVAKKYKGNAQELANADKKALNAKKSFTEAVGSIVNPTVDLIDNLFANIYTKAAAAIKELEKQLTNFGDKIFLKNNVKTATTYYENKDTGESFTGAKFFSDEQLERTVKLLETIKKRNKEEESALVILSDELQYRKRLQKEAEREKKEAAKKEAVIAEEKKTQGIAEAALKTYRETIATKEQELKLRKELGENITQEQENEEMLQTRQAAYIKLIQDAQGTITGDAERERIEREEILKLVEATTDAQKEADAEKAKKALLKDIDDALNDSKKLKQSEIMAKQISELEIEYAKLTADKKLEIEKEYTEKLESLRKQQQKMVQEERTKEEQDYYKSIEKKIEIVSSFASQYTSIMSTISDIVTQQAKNEATVKQAEVEKQYQQGIISQEEYEKRKGEIEKEAAEKTYKIQMWQWAASIAQATANTAQAMVSTLAQEAGPAALKIAMAAMVAAAGGAQLATIIANKPIPPSRFATGGIVGGTSYTGDRVTAHVNSGEMILNRMQQRNLFDSINSNSIGTKPQMNIKIFNSASNEVSARPEMTEDGMRIMIRKIVSDDIGSGRMNKSLIAAQSSFGGTRYTN